MKHCYDSKCHDLAVHFFGEGDPRLEEISQAIQDAVECFPDVREHPDGCACEVCVGWG